MNQYADMRNETGRLIRTIQAGVLIGLVLTAILSF